MYSAGTKVLTSTTPQTPSSQSELATTGAFTHTSDVLEQAIFKLRAAKQRVRMLARYNENDDERLRDATEMAQVGVHCTEAAIERAKKMLKPGVARTWSCLMWIVVVVRPCIALVPVAGSAQHVFALIGCLCFRRHGEAQTGRLCVDREPAGTLQHRARRGG